MFTYKTVITETTPRYTRVDPKWKPLIGFAKHRNLPLFMEDGTGAAMIEKPPHGSIWRSDFMSDLLAAVRPAAVTLAKINGKDYLRIEF